MTRAYLSLGSNLAERADHLRATLGALSRAPRTELLGISRIYETRAVEVEDEQPDYLNCVAEVECDLAAVELLRLCQGIEVALGRDRKGEKTPRTVDIDVLLFGEEVVGGQDFRVPHRGILRAYNLVGLADLDPSVRVPGAGAVTDLLAGSDLGGVREYGGRREGRAGDTARPASRSAGPANGIAGCRVPEGRRRTRMSELARMKSRTGTPDGRYPAVEGHG